MIEFFDHGIMSQGYQLCDWKNVKLRPSEFYSERIVVVLNHVYVENVSEVGTKQVYVEALLVQTNPQVREKLAEIMKNGHVGTALRKPYDE
jgi:hypothetical protein